MARFWHCIADDCWRRLEAAILTTGFWSLDPIDDRRGLDGASWTIERRRRDIYRGIERWSPHDQIYDLGGTFFDLAGPPIGYPALLS
jgi:hypothetical protein